jgi:hypothetical protein
MMHKMHHIIANDNWISAAGRALNGFDATEQGGEHEQREWRSGIVGEMRQLQALAEKRPASRRALGARRFYAATGLGPV